MVEEIPSSRVCSICNELKDINDFSLNKSKKYGRSYRCKSCHNEYNKKHYKNNSTHYRTTIKDRKRKIREWFNEFKKGLKCDKCGDMRWYVLDFHHNDPKEKDFNIAQGVSSGYSIETFKKEVDKCNILCSNCHRELHYLEKQT